MAGRSKIRRWILAIAIVLSVLISPLPLRPTDRQRIVADSAKRLVSLQPVRQKFARGELSGWQYMPFIDSAGIKERSLRWHFVNDTDLDFLILQDQDFQTITTDQFREATEDISWYESNAALEITNRDPTGENDELHLRFNYYYGWLGAQGFRVRAYRCILGTWYYFEHEWIS